jgi:hypothetical protein
MLSQVVYVAEQVGANTSGDALYAAPVAILARVEQQLQFVRVGADGEEVTSSHSIITALHQPLGYTPPGGVTVPTTLKPNDRVWLPGVVPATSADPAGKLIKSVAPVPDEDGSTLQWEGLF